MSTRSMYAKQDTQEATGSGVAQHTESAYDSRGSPLFQTVNRDYDPQLGRYIQADPIGIAGGDNLYAYVDSNPLAFVDPLGLAKCQNGTREQRWLELANDSNSRLPKEMVDHINRHNGKGVSKRFGQELAHKPKQSAAQGHDYREAIPKTTADHRGIQHRYLKESKTGTTIKRPRKKLAGGKVSLPPLGALP